MSMRQFDFTPPSHVRVNLHHRIDDMDYPAGDYPLVAGPAPLEVEVEGRIPIPRMTVTVRDGQDDSREQLAQLIDQQVRAAMGLERNYDNFSVDQHHGYFDGHTPGASWSAEPETEGLDDRLERFAKRGLEVAR